MLVNIGLEPKKLVGLAAFAVAVCVSHVRFNHFLTSRFHNKAHNTNNLNLSLPYYFLFIS